MYVKIFVIYKVFGRYGTKIAILVDIICDFLHFFWQIFQNIIIYQCSINSRHSMLAHRTFRIINSHLKIQQELEVIANNICYPSTVDVFILSEMKYQVYCRKLCSRLCYLQRVLVVNRNKEVNYIRHSMLAFPLLMAVSSEDCQLSMKDKQHTYSFSSFFFYNDQYIR